MYEFITEILWDALHRFYYAYMCRSIKVIEKHIAELSSNTEIHISMFRAWKRIQKVGTLQEVLNFWKEHKDEIGEKSYLTVKVARRLMAKIRKEDLSYRAELFVTFIELMNEFKGVHQMLKMGIDSLSALMQEMFDSVVDNLPRENGKIAVNWEIEGVKINGIVRSLYKKFPKYLKNSQANRIEDIKSLYYEDCAEAFVTLNEASKLLKTRSEHLPEGQIYEVDKVLFEREKRLNKRSEHFDYTIAPEEINDLVSEMIAIYKSVRDEQNMKEAIIKGDNIEVFLYSHYRNTSLSKDTMDRIFGIWLLEFLDNYDHDKAIKVTIIQEKNGEVRYNWKAIDVFLDLMFSHLKKTDNNNLALALKQKIGFVFRHLSSFRYKPLMRQLKEKKVAWSQRDERIVNLILWPGSFIGQELESIK